MNIPNPYDNRHYIYYIAVPLLLMAASLGLIFFGPGLQPDIDLKGGILISVQAQGAVDEAALSEALLQASGQNAHIRSFDSPTGVGVDIELPLDPALDKADALLLQTRNLQQEYDQARIDASQGLVDENVVQSLRGQVTASARQTMDAAGKTLTALEPTEAVIQAENAVSESRTEYRSRLTQAVQDTVAVDSISIRQVGSSLSRFFLAKTQEVVLLAFVLSAILVFLVFRSIPASVAVIFGAVADIVITAGAMSLLGIPISLASIAALLMLIGLSLDTDMMLTTRVVKRSEHTPKIRAFEALKTGFLMNATTVVAFGVLAGLALTLQIPTYYQIGVVATIGGLVDFVATWMGNAPLILKFKEDHA